MPQNVFVFVVDRCQNLSDSATRRLTVPMLRVSLELLGQAYGTTLDASPTKLNATCFFGHLKA